MSTITADTGKEALFNELRRITMNVITADTDEEALFNKLRRIPIKEMSELLYEQGRRYVYASISQTQTFEEYEAERIELLRVNGWTVEEYNVERIKIKSWMPRND